MIRKVDNYKLQARQAKKRFLTYDQQELIRRCGLKFDDTYFYLKFLSQDYRLCRQTGDIERLDNGIWVDGNAFGEVMTILDWLCDSRPDRYIAGRWANPVTQGYNFHSDLQQGAYGSYAQVFDTDPRGFARGCEVLKGERYPGGDMAYVIELVDGLKVLVQLWHSDEEFPARICCLWDENAACYIRYETTWFAAGLLLERIRENMKK